MRLSELKSGDTAVIIKILGHGAFRKRMIEMGFVKGREIKVLMSAPLKDPVKYEIMGYEVSPFGGRACRGRTHGIRESGCDAVAHQYHRRQQTRDG